MPTTSEMLTDWYQRVSVTQRAHYISADQFSYKKFLLGIPALGLSAFVGSTVFATLQKQPCLPLQICIGFASVAAGLLTGLQTFMNYSERAEKHRVAGAKYGALGRELEQLRSSGVEPSTEVLEKVRKTLDSLALESPNNPIPIYIKAGGEDLLPKKVTL